MSSEDVKIVNVAGQTIWIVDAPFPDGKGGSRTGSLGLLQNDLVAIAQRGESAVIAAFYGQVVKGTILTQHIFRGVRRSMLTDENADADGNVLIYSRKPSIDWAWSGDRYTGELIKVDPPAADLVFVVLVSLNTKHKDQFPMIDGWINCWNWLHEDKGLPEAPIDWIDRYEELVWSSSKSTGGLP